MAMKNPPHPGGVVLRQCIAPLGLTITQAAAALGVTRTTLSELVNGKRGISPEMAVRLSKVFGGSAESWVIQQGQYELAQVRADRIKLKRLVVYLPLRINLPGSPVDRHKGKKSYTRGLSWPPSGPLTLVTPSKPSRADARRPLRPPPLAASHHHCLLTPPLAAATAARGTAAPRAASRRDPSAPPPWPASAAASAWPSPCRWSARAAAAAGASWHAAGRNYSTTWYKRQLLPQAVLALAERGTRRPTAATCWRMVRLTRSINAVLICQPQRGQHLLDGRQGAEHHAMGDADQTPPAHGLDHLRIEQLRAAASSAAWAQGLWPAGVPAAPTGRSASAARWRTP